MWLKYPITNLWIAKLTVCFRWARTMLWPGRFQESSPKTSNFAARKSPWVKTWLARIWAVAEGIADGWLKEEMDNVTSHNRDLLSRFEQFNILIQSFYRTCSAADSLSRSQWPQFRYQDPWATLRPGCKFSPASAWARAVQADGKLKSGSWSHLF